VWIDAVSVKHYLNAIKAKQSALSARKPLVGGRETNLCSRPFGLELLPFKRRAYMDSPPLVEQFNHCIHTSFEHGDFRDAKFFASFV